MKNLVIIFSLACMLGSQGCAPLIKKVAIDSTSYVIEDALKSFFEEPDITMAEQAAPANLKLLEGLIKGDPQNEKLLIMGSQLFTGYTFGFVEEQVFSYDREEEAEKNNLRAKKLYKRAMNYGFRALNKDPNFTKALNGNYEDFENFVNKMGQNRLEALFWAAYSWGNWINLSKSDPEAVANLGRVEIMMRRVLELDETYYNGAAHLFYVVYYAGRPALLGGNPKKALAHYEKAVAINNDKYLMADLIFAQYYAVQTQDKDLYEKLLNGVLAKSPDIFPEERLTNELVHEKAKLMLSLVDELF